jgi:hypothetical protein
MQINDGSGWKSLPVMLEPKEVDGGSYGFEVPWEPTLPGFALADKLANARGHAMFRANGEQGPGHPYWVQIRKEPLLLPDRPMTVWLAISPADLSDS